MRLPSEPPTIADKIAPQSTGDQLAKRVAKLWTHRECEANFILGQFCRVGLHRWRQLHLAQLVPEKDIRFCFRCKHVKIDGTVFDL